MFVQERRGTIQNFYRKSVSDPLVYCAIATDNSLQYLGLFDLLIGHSLVIV